MTEKKIYNFISSKKWEIIQNISKKIETPFLLIDLNKIKNNYKILNSVMPYADIFYAVKANPSKKIINLLNNLGSHFDIASKQELDLTLECGVSPNKISFSNTIKKAKDIHYAYEKGVRLFACDSEAELKKIAQNAPGSNVFFRILTDGTGAEWPLSKKFGSHPSMIYDLILSTKNLNIVPYGLSFHVGSQQHDIGQWDNAISQCSHLISSLKENGINLQMLNLGGGFPTKYIKKTRPLKKYTEEITRFLKEYFSDEMPRIIIEPGRSLVGNAGVIVSEIILISKKTESDLFNWVYLDIGKFNGLIETIDESIKYPIFSDRHSTDFSEVILAGPTCDSLDILYENYKYSLPADIKIGDKIYIFSTGAYTQSYSTVGFNGFPPLKIYYLSEVI